MLSSTTSLPDAVLENGKPENNIVPVNNQAANFFPLLLLNLIYLPFSLQLFRKILLEYLLSWIVIIEILESSPFSTNIYLYFEVKVTWFQQQKITIFSKKHEFK